MFKEGSMEQDGRIFRYEIKHFDEPSEYGIDGGRISKLEIMDGERTVAKYERGWDIRPSSKSAKASVDLLMKKYN